MTDIKDYCQTQDLVRLCAEQKAKIERLETDNERLTALIRDISATRDTAVNMHLADTANNERLRALLRAAKDQIHDVAAMPTNTDWIDRAQAMTQHVSHRHSDEIHELRANNERLRAAYDASYSEADINLHAERVTKELRADNERLRAALSDCIHGRKDWMEKAKAALEQKP